MWILKRIENQSGNFKNRKMYASYIKIDLTFVQGIVIWYLERRLFFVMSI